jgi:hypothetical protein
MPLIDLKTDLKSLRYGKDTIGGGYSGQPYIQKTIPDGFNTLGARPDFILRGGSNAYQSAADDVSRLTQMFFDLKSPNGLFFITKQNVLSRTAVRTQTSGRLLNEGVYTPLNTLLQTGGNMLGLHLLKQGLDPFQSIGAYAGINNENIYAGKVKNNQPNTKNRLFLLNEAIKISKPLPFDGITLNSLTGDNVLSYGGGPGSILGVGKTNIRYALGARTGEQNILFKGNEDKKALFLGENFKPITQEDFRLKLRNAKGNDIVTSNESSYISRGPGYGLTSPTNLNNRTNYGNPGLRGNVINYTSGKLTMGTSTPTGPVDKINALPIYRSEYVTQDPIKNDLVKFRIASIDNDEPNFKTFMHFRALLEGISDNYNSDWTATKYLGRGESFFTYGGFSRTMALSWTIVAQSKEELIPMYKKLNYLSSLMAPDYSKNGYMRGNLLQLTIGGYIYEQPGFFTTLNYTIPEDTTWEIGINSSGGEDSTVKELPHRIVVQANFTPIHNFVPKKMQIIDAMTTASLIDSNGYGNQRFIAIANGSTDEFSNYNKFSSTNVSDFYRQQEINQENLRSQAAAMAQYEEKAMLSELEDTGETFNVGEI